jgi:hypothetical protein
VTYLKHFAHLTHYPFDPLTYPTVPLDPPDQSKVPTKQLPLKKPASVVEYGQLKVDRNTTILT